MPQKPLFDTRGVTHRLLGLQVGVRAAVIAAVPVRGAVVEFPYGGRLEGLSHRGPEDRVRGRPVHHAELRIQLAPEGGVVVVTHASHKGQGIEQGELVLGIEARGIHVFPYAYEAAIGILYVVVDGLALQLPPESEDVPIPEVPAVAGLALLVTHVPVLVAVGIAGITVVEVPVVEVAPQRKEMALCQVELEPRGYLVTVFVPVVGLLVRAETGVEIELDSIVEPVVPLAEQGMPVGLDGILPDVLGALVGVGDEVSGVFTDPVPKGHVCLGQVPASSLVRWPGDHPVSHPILYVVPAVGDPGPARGLGRDLPGDDVDHTRDGVTAVEGGTRPLDHLYPLDHLERDLVEPYPVLPHAPALAASHHPVAVDEDEGVAVVEAQALHAGPPGIGAEDIVVHGGIYPGDLLQDVHYVLGVAALDVLPGDHHGLHRHVLQEVRGLGGGYHHLVHAVSGPPAVIPVRPGRLGQ